MSLSPEAYRRLVHEAGHVACAEHYAVRWRLVGPSEVALNTTDLDQAGGFARVAIACAGAIAEAHAEIAPSTPRAIAKRMSDEDVRLAAIAPESTPIDSAVDEARNIVCTRWSRITQLVTLWAQAIEAGEFRPAQGEPAGLLEG